MSFLPRIQKAAYLMARIAQNGGAPLALGSLNDKISQSYCEQIVRMLRAAGLVRSSRGPGGGYVLTRPAEEISLGQIADSLDFATPDDESLGLAGLDRSFSEAHEAALGRLDAVTLSSVLRG